MPRPAMDPYETVLAPLLGAWLLLSAIAQLGPVADRLPEYQRRYDVLGLVPRYHFFAPRPGVHDYHLLVRTRPGGGTGAYGPWQEIGPRPRRRWWHVLWNPDRRARKQLFDLTTALTRNDARCEDPATPLSLPYLMVLQHVSRRVPAGRLVQFAVARSAGYRTGERPGLLFVSRDHRVT
ncbi:hypothetical protein GCM10010218_47220 [Streptomyces mashuensis]|uniref:Uncharacterized protein n=1 Tax=Streptomyces mashuensis TaxID=33904 RepID=A0A919B698_9ACTN|nr:hypothetical protein [Streptomyces mashuensis]GHF60359.1 hypothetical protein GCM10010218_47220 [Streptomyces mashuensis]